MVLSLIRRRAKKNTKVTSSSQDSDYSDMSEISIPAHFRCPISLDMMKDPVTLSTGITYDRDSIEKWIESGNRTCPMTNQVLSSSDQIPNHSLRRMIQDWCVQNRSHGVERIPTPRIPVTPAEIASVCVRIAEAAERNDAKKCGELVGKIKAWAKDSERNRKCIAKSRAGLALALSFESFCGVVSSEGALVEELLSVLTWVLGCVDEEGRARLENDRSLRCLVSFLRGNDLSSRQNAVLVIKELLSSSSSEAKVVESLAGIEGSVEGLVRMIREPICPRATKASLTAIFFMINKNDNTTTKTRALFIELGLVSILFGAVLENSERGVCERASRVLDVILEAEEAREKAKGNALTIPLVVKRILRVSDSATESFVSILWKLLAVENDVDGVFVALESGGFEKMLVMLQIGCGDKLKEKVTELLKIFNLHRRRLECVDSSADYKYLKRPF